MSGEPATMNPEMPAPVTESEKVADWRMRVALEAGADPETATFVSTQTLIDLHEWLDMVQAGCEPKLAYQILAP